jgi:flagellar motor switch protein FliN/FliY
MQASDMTDSKNAIANAFCDNIHAALSEICHSEWNIKVDESSDAQPNLANAVALRLKFSGACSGEALIGIDSDVLPRLALRDIAEDAQDIRSLREAKILSAFQSHVASLEESLSKGGAVSISVELAENPTLADDHVITLSGRANVDGNESEISLHLCLTQKLKGDLERQFAIPFEFPHAAQSSAANLDLVMDVALNVTLRFGQRQLALREVLELASGSVVELDRQVDEPVDLILDGRVVARGEAVIIDGNYGMRVTQVLQPFVP